MQSNQGLGQAGSKTVTNYKQWSASNTRTLSSTLVNDARFGYTKFFNSIGTLSAFTNDVVGALKIPNLKSGDPVTWGIPDVSFTGFTDIGDITDGPFAVDNNTLQFVDKLTWLKGRHTIGMGAEYDRQHFNEVGNQFSRGQFAFQANTHQEPGEQHRRLRLRRVPARPAVQNERRAGRRRGKIRTERLPRVRRR